MNKAWGLVDRHARGYTNLQICGNHDTKLLPLNTLNSLNYRKSIYLWVNKRIVYARIVTSNTPFTHPNPYTYLVSFKGVWEPYRISMKSEITLLWNVIKYLIRYIFIDTIDNVIHLMYIQQVKAVLLYIRIYVLSQTWVEIRVR